MSDSLEDREPDELTSIQRIVEARLAELHTCVPAKVVSYDHAKQEATVQPAFKRVYLDDDDAEQEVDYPAISGVPVAFPRGKGWSVTWPLEKDDPVWLVVSQRSLDAYLETDGKQVIDPADGRKHDLSDSWCYPGGGTPKNASAIASATDLVIGLEDASCEVHVKPDGEIYAKMPASKKFKIGSADAAKALALAEICDARLDALESFANSHMHGNGNQGSPTTGPVSPLTPGHGGSSTACERTVVDA